MVAATNQHFEMQLPETDIFFVEFLGMEKELLRTQLALCEKICIENGSTLFESAEDDALDDVWESRRGCYFAALKYSNSKCIFTDCCCPMSRLPECLSEAEADFQKANIPCMLCCHIAD